jgi:hypothetical protein
LESQLRTDVAANRPAASAGKGYFYATDTGQLSHSDGTNWTTIGPASNNILTLGELCQSVTVLFDAGANAIPPTTVSDSCAIFVAPYACTVEQLALEVQRAGVTASDTNYWSISLRKQHGGTSAAGNYTTTTIATKTTQATGGALMPKRGEWNFDTVTFDATNKVLVKGDVLDLAFTATGTPDPIKGCVATFRIQPT